MKIGITWLPTVGEGVFPVFWKGLNPTLQIQLQLLLQLQLPVPDGEGKHPVQLLHSTGTITTMSESATASGTSVSKGSQPWKTNMWSSGRMHRFHITPPLAATAGMIIVARRPKITPTLAILPGTGRCRRNIETIGSKIERERRSLFTCSLALQISSATWQAGMTTSSQFSACM